MRLSLCIVGGGYVGLPLAVAFAKYYDVTVITKSSEHADELSVGYDRTETFTSEQLLEHPIHFSCNIQDASDSTVFIVTVPTPIDEANNPDLTPIKEATQSIASVLKIGDIVIYESTVYIGCTESLCVPMLEQQSGLIYNHDFYCGFSPERINPADKERTIHTVKKIISGSTPKTTDTMEEMYGKIVHAGLHRAPSIKVAEASKLIENVQRDVNIALMNEFSHLFNAIGIDTQDVLDAASTKWNFLPFRPGLVGGHCIGIDPYYMLYNGEEYKVPLPMIALSRKINNNMSDYIVEKTINLLQTPEHASVLLLGVTFKENCPDIRNSQSAVIFKQLQNRVKTIHLYDPVADPKHVFKTYGIEPISLDVMQNNRYDAILISVAHTHYKELPLHDFLKDSQSVILDIKGILPKEASSFRL